MSEVTRLLDAAAAGDRQAAADLLPLVYDELGKLAAARMADERPGQTLQPTALVHEAYIRLVGGTGQAWDSRGHFFAAAAEAMRRILVDQARRKHSQKRGGDRRRVELDAAALPAAPADDAADDLLALDEALRQFEAEDPLRARLVKLRYFAGLSLPMPPRRSASPSPPPNATGSTPAPGCTARSGDVTPDRRQYFSRCAEPIGPFLRIESRHP